MRWFRRTLKILILAAVVMFAALNMQIVNLTLLPFAPTDGVVTGLRLPLALVILAVLAIGLLVGVLIEYGREAGFRRELSMKSRELSRLQGELSRLKSALKQTDTEETAALLLPRR